MPGSLSTPTPMTPMPDLADAFAQLMRSHRSIRQFQADKPVDSAFIDRVLVQALAGSSSSGNLNMVSVVKTFDPERKARLHELHGGQPMVLQAPLVLSFCADSHRTRAWLAQRQARAGFADFISWHVASFDALILAQTTALALESHGLGICYMGTTLHSMQGIAELLELPENCLPVTSLVVGWPAEAPAQRDRLPGTAWIHNERYQPPTPESITRDYGERERRGWDRYRAIGPEMVARMQEHGITSLAQYYTSQIKYDPDRFALDSAALLTLLRARGFLS
jgi:nitroreductase